MDEWTCIEEAAAVLQGRLGEGPRVGVVLGSGLGGLTDRLEDAVRVPYGEIPGWPVSGVEGHEGILVAGTLDGVPVAAMKGRVHLYEGHGAAAVVRGVRTLVRIGCGPFLLTNAAGGVNEAYAPGDVMWLADHLNLTGANPLTGPNPDSLGPRFPDLSAAYDQRLFPSAERAAAAAGIPLHRGVYAALPGPSYETPAEIRMLRILGADAVGMSTVPEAIALAHAGCRTVALSLITNMAAGILHRPLSHAEVTETADSVKEPFERFVARVIATLGRGEETP